MTHPARFTGPHVRVWLWLDSAPLELSIICPYRCECARLRQNPALRRHRESRPSSEPWCIGSFVVESRLAEHTRGREWIATRVAKPGSALQWGRVNSPWHLWDEWIFWHAGVFAVTWSKEPALRAAGQCIAEHPGHGPPCDGQFDGQSRDCEPGATRTGLEVDYIDLCDRDPDGDRGMDFDGPRVRVSVLSANDWRWIDRVGHVSRLDALGRVEVAFPDSDRQIFTPSQLAPAQPAQRDPGSLCERGQLQSLCDCDGP